ncbi:MAG: precorrin-6A reductase [Peptostreptococcaceae bacterium]|nr:precorrin-6A reductase [Peptostreptococcaceae bacterium]
MKIVIFAGTSEGKATATLLAEKGHELFVTVATEYGKCVFEESLTQQNVHLLEGRLNIDEMTNLVEQADLVTDATHPYAVEVSKNIVTACERAQKPYLRILRGNQDAKAYEDVILWAKDQDDAIRIMNEYDGRVLMTTGSKDLPKYTAVNNYKERLFPRILPDMVSLEIAMGSDYKKKNIICMQGPFTHEVNESMLEMLGADFLLTKETGESGGYYEKLSACRAANAKAIVIKRPPEEIDKKSDAKIPMGSCTLHELNAFLSNRGESDFKLEQLELWLSDYRARDEEKNPPLEAIYTKEETLLVNDETKDREALLQNEMSDVTVPKISFETAPRFPIFLDLKDKLVTVIGSGNIARRRIKALLSYGAKVRVISPNASSNLEMAGILDWEEDIASGYRGEIEIINRTYEYGDLKDAVIAVTATDNREVNHQVYKEACERKIFVSVADKKDESSYFFPATWLGDSLSVGIVGDGTDHRYVRQSADAIREALDKLNLTPKARES